MSSVLVSMPTDADGEWEFSVDGRVVKVISLPAYKHFSTPGCACRPILVLNARSIFVGGQDDCPVHNIST